MKHLKTLQEHETVHLNGGHHEDEDGSGCLTPIIKIPAPPNPNSSTNR